MSRSVLRSVLEFTESVGREFGDHSKRAIGITVAPRLFERLCFEMTEDRRFPYTSGEEIPEKISLYHAGYEITIEREK